MSTAPAKRRSDSSPIGRKGGTYTVPEGQRGGTYEGRDVVTWLLLYGTDTLYPLPRSNPHYSLGSAAKQDIVISSPFVSAQHCRLTRTPLGLQVADLKSKNGTYVDGKRMRKAFVLEPGRTFVVGPRSHRLVALNDEMCSRYPALTAILGYEDEHAFPGQAPCPGDLMVAAGSTAPLLITSEAGCDQERLAEIIHEISVLRERSLIRLSFAGDEQPEHSDVKLDLGADCTVVLNLGDNDARLDPMLTSRLFSPRHPLRVIALARSTDVARRAIGDGYMQRMKSIWLEPLSGRSDAIHRLIDSRFEEIGSSLRVAMLTAHNQDALRSHHWPGNFVSLRHAAEWLTVLAREDSLRRAATSLRIPTATFHNWYAHILKLSLPLLSGDYISSAK